ncbi:MAG: hypothetical protein HKM93_08370 [Desulfobacteraceae bacterium]|nr:hypothetical protein [Desulfobacteraceae bacterium]
MLISKDKKLGYYHAYWLIKEDGQEEYVPLLITNGPIEYINFRKLKKMKDHQYSNDDFLRLQALIIITYAKDSIWNTSFNPFQPANMIHKINHDEKRLIMERYKGEIYKYSFQLCPQEKLLNLLRNPYGTISIHRMAKPLAGGEEIAEELILAIQNQNK